MTDQLSKITDAPPTPWNFKVTDTALAKMAGQLRAEHTMMLNGDLPSNTHALDRICEAIGGIEGLRLWRVAFNAAHMAKEMGDHASRSDS